MEALRTIVQLAQLAGVLFFILTAIFTYRTVRATERNVVVSQEGQITDRFTKAIDQLGSGKLEIQLGGIYALERIARDSAKDHWPIMEVLTTYIREHAPRREDDEGPVTRPPTEIQAILTVLGRRNQEHERGNENRLDLSETNLRGANLREAQLQRVNLMRAQLQGAHLQKAHLEEAILGAELQHANLTEAHLEKAELWGAHLEYAILTKAHLEGADLRGVPFQRATLIEAHLEGADLTSARLGGAYLMGAHFQDTTLVRADLRARFQGLPFDTADPAIGLLPPPDFTRAILTGANLQHAQLQGAILRGADFRGIPAEQTDPMTGPILPADLTGAHLEGVDLTGVYYNNKTQWPEGFIPPDSAINADLQHEQLD